MLTERDRAWLHSRWQRDVWFMLSMLALGTLTVLMLSTWGTALRGAGGRASVTAMQHSQSATQSSGGSAAAVVRSAQTDNFMVKPDNAGLMQPAVDSQGNIWFGEMSTNRLARLDSHTGAVTTWEPPNGRYNIMAAAVDAQGAVWFTEQAANYIGRFDPTTQTFTTFPLETLNGRSIGPQDLEFDSSGNLWFTAVSGGMIGRLDPATGAIRMWQIPLSSSGGRSYPYSLAVTSSGEIWFGDLAGGAVGTLDPATGKVRLFPLADPQAAVFSMAADSQGRIWFTELQQGKLGMVDSHTGKLTEYPVPSKLGRPAGLYALTTVSNGDVWFACSSVNALIRYQPGPGIFTFFTLSIPESVPYGLAVDRSGDLWFTADAPPTNYVGRLHP